MELIADRSKYPSPGHVKVSNATEDELLIGKTGGKKRAPAGLPHIPGGKFGRPLWDDYWKDSIVGKQADRRRAEITLSDSIKHWNKVVAYKNPSLNPNVGTLRATKSVGDIETLVTEPQYTYNFEEHGGARRNPEPYDPFKHGWYHQATRQKIGTIRPNKESHIWAQTIKKSKDHIGYGNGMIGYGDVQATSLSDDCPSWMFGMRTIPGVVGAKAPRWQYCMVEDGKLVTNMRYFQRGPNLSTVETIGGKKPRRPDRFVIDWREAFPISTKPKINFFEDKRASSLIGPGAIVKKPHFPSSAHHDKDPDHRHFWKVERQKYN